jgi:protein gp37
MGVSVESQEETWRIEAARRFPVSLLFVSCEPLLGPIGPWLCHGCGAHVSLGTAGRCLCVDKNPIALVIAGGESGRRPRPTNPHWVRSLRDDCQSAGVPFFFKGWGAWIPSRENIVGYEGIPWPECRKRTALDHGDNRVEFLRVGKKAAGRLLDGREWNEMPKTQIAENER